jgi:hypothetical protein
MNPALAASGSGGLAGALVVIVNGLASHFFGAIVDPSFIAAEVTLVTGLCGVGAHYLTRVAPPASAPASPAQ